MAIDVKKLDLPQLVALRSDVDAEIAVKQQEARSTFVDEMRAAAAARGLNLSDFVDVKKVRGVRAKAEAKYRDPDAPLNTWSGRGRLPKWLQEKVAAGRDKGDFMIEAEEAPKRGRKAKGE